MNKYKKKYMMVRHQGKPLPKVLLRPFIYEQGYLTKDEYKLAALSDRTQFLSITPLIGYFVAAGALVVWTANNFVGTSELFISIFSFLSAVLMRQVVKKIKPNKYIRFNRKNSNISFPVGPISRKTLIAPWDEWEARIAMRASSVGLIRHDLSLVHVPSHNQWQIYSTTDIDILLGYWSFIVQYMDKNGPYPNVPEFKEEKNITDGIGKLDEWENNKLQHGLDDPYIIWLESLKINPELDIANNDIGSPI